ncbi:MAG TPA: hypothetical protein VJR58_04805 [Vineibacter sp.]|nr:hypothetical protein [Vineibacter sp.]
MALVAAIALGIWIVVDLSNNEPLIFDQINVHPALKDRVPSAERLTQQTGSQFETLAAVIGQLRETERASLVRDTDLPKIEILGSGVSFQAVVQVIRRLLGHRELRIGGDIFLSPTSVIPPDAGAATAVRAACDGEVSYVVVRLTTNVSEAADVAELPVCLAKGEGTATLPSAMLSIEALEAMLQRVALRALERINPCGAAAYYTTNWYRRGYDTRMLDPGFERSNAMAAACIATRGEAEAGYAFYQLGRVRGISGKHREAILYYADAEKLHRRSRPWWRRLLHSAGVWSIRLPDLDVLWGVALMNDKRPGEALARFERALGGSASAGAYIGKGNALRELLKAHRTDEALAAICNVYRTGGKRHRFSAELRHVLANFVEDEKAWSCAQAATEEEARIRILGWRRKAVDLQPTERNYLLALGRTLRRVGDRDAAVVAFRDALRFADGNEWEAYAELTATLSPPESPPVPPADAMPQIMKQQTLDGPVRYQAALAVLATGASEAALRRASALLATVSRAQEARLVLACAEQRLSATSAGSTDAAANRKPGVEIDTVVKACLDEIRQRAVTSAR